MSRHAWLTPDHTPASWSWRALLVPNDTPLHTAYFEAVIRGALLLPALAENWEETEGGLPTDETAAIFDQVLESFLMGYSVLPAGTVQAYAGSIAPPGWLLCEGQLLHEGNYPLLYAAIGESFGTAPPGMYYLPDLRGRVVIGAGDTPETSERILGQEGGEEMHQLTGVEMPAHNHNVGYYLRSSKDGTGTSWNARMPGATDILITTEIAGEDEPHNNMQPFLVMNWIIFTGEYP